jgi:peptidoglycan/LPS O-acetylase OafA/YrhL
LRRAAGVVGILFIIVGLFVFSADWEPPFRNPGRAGFAMFIFGVILVGYSERGRRRGQESKKNGG